MFPRSSGLLLHATSLPGGRLGDEALAFADFCAAAGQRWWQMLPVGPPGPGHSPYSALSAFAGSEDLAPRTAPADDGRDAFARAQRTWLDDYALFRALRTAHGPHWTKWPKPLRDRRPSALSRSPKDHGRAVARVVSRQHGSDAAWRAMKRHANERGVGLVGDLPLFVAHGSADVWAHRELFKLKRNGQPRVVTGVPPDYFSKNGQVWNTPHYDWKAMRRRRFRWFKARVDRLFELFDAVRIDHFLGLLRAWEVPAGARTARKGRWAPAPGQALLKALGPRTFIAEDLGLVTPEAHALRESHRMPGMRVLQFSFGGDPWSRPHAFPRNCVVYTGTHDNNTAKGWFREGGDDRRRAARWAGVPARDIHWGLIRVAWTSACDVAIAPVQDVLGLGAAARMNVPGKARGNWGWRMAKGALTRAHARRLRALTEDAGR